MANAVDEKRTIAFKKEKEIHHSVDAQVKELNQLFKEQARCLDDRSLTQSAVLEMAHDFLRKWADLENDHSLRMEKLVKTFVNKEKSGNNGNVSISVCLLGLFSTCSKLSKMYQQLSETITAQVVDRLQVARDESQLMRKNCGPVLEQCQDSVRRAGQAVLETIRPYHTASSNFASADQQLRDTQAEHVKVAGPGSAKSGSGNDQPPSKPMMKKQASVERKLAERHAKRDAMLAQVNSKRNDHIMSLASANAGLHCYNTEVVPKYIRALDYSARPSICLALQSLARFLENQAERSVAGAAEDLKSAVTRCQAENDVALMSHYAPRLFAACKASKEPTGSFRFHPLRTDEPGDLVLQPATRDNQKIVLTNISSENGKKLAAIVGDLERWDQARWATSSSEICLTPGQAPHPPASIENYAQTLKQYAEIAEQVTRNDYHLGLLSTSVQNGSGIYAHAVNSSFSSPQRQFLHSASVENGVYSSSGPQPHQRNSHNLISSGSVGSSSSGDNLAAHASRTPVFGGSIEDHLNRVGLGQQSFDSTGRSVSATPQNTPASASLASMTSSGSSSQPPHPPLPPVVVCCIGYLSKFGLRQQGVFRINGSQIEISELKSKFERCENPLAACDNPSLVNAAASVLKSYFRQLREPLLLPSSNKVTFEQWMTVSSSPHGMVEAIRLLISKMPAQIRTVAAFLFAFLNRVQEHSSENMMDAYNLAVCFAPCLLPTPTESDQMQYFNALAAIIKTMILNANVVFREEELGLYDEVINPRPQRVDVASQETPSSISKAEQTLVGKGVRKASLTTGEDGGSGANGVPSLTRQFRTLGSINPTAVMSPTSARAFGADGLSVALPEFDCEAMFNFTARNGHELSMRRGDRMKLIRRLSEQWWEVTTGSRSGLVPANYLRMLTPAASPAILSISSQHAPTSGQSSRSRSVTGNSTQSESATTASATPTTTTTTTAEHSSPAKTSGITASSSNGAVLLTRYTSVGNSNALLKANGQVPSKTPVSTSSSCGAREPESDMQRHSSGETNENLKTGNSGNNSRQHSIETDETEKNFGKAAGNTANNRHPNEAHVPVNGGQHLWMRRQISASNTNSNGESRKTETAVIEASVTTQQSS